MLLLVAPTTHEELKEYLHERKQHAPEDRAKYVASLELFAERTVDVLEISLPDVVLSKACRPCPATAFRTCARFRAASRSAVPIRCWSIASAPKLWGYGTTRSSRGSWAGKAQRLYLAWRPPRTPKPSFHVPEGFGVLSVDF
jgi:hypothetical protein